MAYKKKLTNEEFVKAIINKELEIANADIRYDDILALTKEEQNKLEWWSKYSFKKYTDFAKWKEFFCEKFYEWQPKTVNKTMMEREFSWINLMWGLKYGFDYEIKTLMEDKTFLKGLNAFKTFVPDYDIDTIHSETNKTIMNMYDSSFHKKFVKEIDAFVEKEKDNLKHFYDNVDETTPDILKEPMAIMLFYGIIKKQKHTIENWKFTDGELREVLKIMNISDDILR